MWSITVQIESSIFIHLLIYILYYFLPLAHQRDNFGAPRKMQFHYKGEYCWWSWCFSHPHYKLPYRCLHFSFQCFLRSYSVYLFLTCPLVVLIRGDLRDISCLDVKFLFVIGYQSTKKKVAMSNWSQYFFYKYKKYYFVVVLINCCIFLLYRTFQDGLWRKWNWCWYRNTCCHASPRCWIDFGKAY